ncbi:MAG: hypothetical protein Q4G14_06430 [Paracoccus sp. (in: a-proteobacteria)]|uniref:hypothetical protein n=1 Tax=Paracoccus sp. TaxID=267 RepID=UPI0026E0E33B|nr:hypothetical protein [Paracoccus sp. (in: a-proteobacteria)]MDO5612866.1 hypothetical protein [Paracoccus sp. (in: a-proteobacteria)]
MMIVLVILGMMSGGSAALGAVLPGLGVPLIFPACLFAGGVGMLVAAAIIATRRGTPNLPHPKGLPV